MRRTIIKKSAQEQIIDQVEEIDKKVQESIGKYGIILDFIAKERSNMYANLISATKGGRTLDLVEKYWVFKDLNN